MGYVAILPFLRGSIATAENIPEGEKTEEYWAKRLSVEWTSLKPYELEEKLLAFFHEFNRLAEFEHTVGNLRANVQALEVMNARQSAKIKELEAGSDDLTFSANWQAPTDEQFAEMRKIAAEGDAKAALEHPVVVARIQALETALTPFDREDVLKLFEGVADDEAGQHTVEIDVNLADLRRARKALEAKT